jgi:hypothetical protein
MRGLALSLVTAIVLAPAVAVASPTRQACVTAYEETQTAMRRSRLLAARASLQTCLDEACPALLRGDCATWLKEVEARTPTVVVECVQDGATVRDVRVLVDGAVREGAGDGKAMELDPGTHSFRVEPVGTAPISVDAVVREGEKLKVVRIELPGREKPPAGKAPLVGENPATQPPPVMTRPVPWTVYATAGLGLAAGAGFGAFAVLGSSGKGDLEPCKPDCSAERISEVRTQFLVADVLLGVSAVALAASAYLFFTRPSIPKAATTGRAWLPQGAIAF